MRAAAAGLVVAAVGGQVLMHEVVLVDPGAEIVVRGCVRDSGRFSGVAGVDTLPAPENHVAGDDHRGRGQSLATATLTTASVATGDAR